jgi:hypothetical protein
MPALTALGKRAQRRQMRKIVQGGTAEEAFAMFAHCSSVEDLQFVASLLQEEIMSR